MNVKCISFLVFTLFFSSLGIAKDRHFEKCQEWKTLKRLRSNKNYEVIHDQSVYSKQDANYKTLKIALRNGIKVLLISDSSLSESSASLSVNAGSWDDPNESPGMAHFVEHLLFLGTEAYPKESDYPQYILERGGEYNGLTKYDRTSYGFSVPKQAFSGALDRFSHFFIDPLFTPSAIQREVNAVHHEFEDSIEDDGVRVWRVLKENGNSEHPNKKLSCGNLESLARTSRSDIVKWFKTHYRPEEMRVVLMANEPLGSLAEKASYYFSRIPSLDEKKKIKQQRSDMTSLNQRGHVVCIKPAFKGRFLCLTWELPAFFLTLENSKAAQLLEMALDHESEGSLSKILEKEGLAQKVDATFWRISQEHGFFMMDVFLTEEGTSRYEEVISRCFQALERIKELGIPEYLLEGLKLKQAAQQESSSESNFDYVIKVSSDLLDEEIEGYPNKTYTIKSDLIAKANSLLRGLSPFECIYFLIALPEEAGVKLSRIERWMGSEYVIRKIPESKLLQWSQENPYLEIAFQSEEETLRSEKKQPDEAEEESPTLTLLVDNERARIRWTESGPEQDSIDSCFSIAMPLMSSSVKQVALSEIFIYQLNELLKEEFVSSEEVFWNLEVEGVDVSFFLSVPKEGYLEYFRRFFSVLRNTTTSKAQFERIKKMSIDSYSGDPSPLEYAHQLLDSFLSPLYYTKMELYHAFFDLKFEEYESFQESYFDQIFLEGVFLGETNQNQLLELWQQISSILDVEPYDLEKDRGKEFGFPQEGQSYFVLQKTHRHGNALILLIEAGEVSQDLQPAHKVLAMLFRSEFYYELRTKQQTAYTLYAWAEKVNEKIYHCFAVQSSTHAPLDLLMRVEEFVNDFALRFSSCLTRDRFNVIRKTLVADEKKQKKLVKKEEDIALIEGRIESLNSITYEQVLSAIPPVFSEENRKRLAILIEGSQKSTTPLESFYDLTYLPIEKENFYKQAK